MTQNATDEARILEIIAGMFDAVSWTPERAPDMEAFRASVRDDAVLVPAARPVAPTSISAFTERMSGLHANGAMRSFEEKPTGTIVKVFGNLAVAIGGFEMLADGSPGRGVNGFLFVRNEGDWQIAAMAWDNEGPDTLLPDELA